MVFEPSNRELSSFEFRNPNKTFYDQHQIVFGVIKQLIMIAKEELGPCWVESQSSVTNHGKDIIEEIIDFRAAPEKVRDFFSHVTAKLALRRDIWN